MTAGVSHAATPRDGHVRAVYEEYDLDGTRVGMIADPHNEHAWVQSDVTVTASP